MELHYHSHSLFSIGKNVQFFVLLPEKDYTVFRIDYTKLEQPRAIRITTVLCRKSCSRSKEKNESNELL